MRISRRELLILGASASLSGVIASCSRNRSTRVLKARADLLAANQDGLRLLPGFSSRIVATTGEKPIKDKAYVWHGAPDGGAVFARPDGGWIYASNAEIYDGLGGAGALSFGADSALEDAYPILSGTTNNCAGGATPWNTWLSCEEYPRGLVWECDPFGKNVAQARPAMGVFQHEAAAADVDRKMIYLTEDEPEGLLYRFVPTHWGKLDAGILEALVRKDGSLAWQAISDPRAKTIATRHQLKNTVAFDGGEGAWIERDRLYFTTKGDNRVWAYDLKSNLLEIVYDAEKLESPILSGVDNIVGDSRGVLYVAEDGGDMQIVALFADGRLKPIAQVDNNWGSEITGPAFDASGTRLYFSSQRSPGVTYEVTGPFALIT